jgi:4-hydroxy-tetrahydrodipicolinate synthase
VRAIADSVDLPLIAYNIPGRSGVGFTAATLGMLSKERLIVGVKESSGSVDFMADTIRAVGPSCQVLSGEDSLVLAALAYGGTGVVSASANAMPKEFVELTTSFFDGRIEDARRVQLSMLPRIRSLFVESNPVPVKTVLALQGVIAEPTVRLPLVELAPASLKLVRLEFSL